MAERKILTDDGLADLLWRISIGEPLAGMNWRFEREELAGGEGWLVRATFDRPDADTGEPGRGTSRWEFVPVGATVSSVVRTCFVLVDLTMRHEVMESFRFDGVRVFDPHRPVGGG